MIASGRVGGDPFRASAAGSLQKRNRCSRAPVKVESSGGMNPDDGANRWGSRGGSVPFTGRLRRGGDAAVSGERRSGARASSRRRLRTAGKGIGARRRQIGTPAAPALQCADAHRRRKPLRRPSSDARPDAAAPSRTPIAAGMSGRERGLGGPDNPGRDAGGGGPQDRLDLPMGGKAADAPHAGHGPSDVLHRRQGRSPTPGRRPPWAHPRPGARPRRARGRRRLPPPSALAAGAAPVRTPLDFGSQRLGPPPRRASFA